MNKLIFNNKEYELIEINNYEFRIYGEEYSDIGYNIHKELEKEIPIYECFSLRIKDKFYGLKLLK
jgi:hypothetical protein